MLCGPARHSLTRGLPDTATLHISVDRGTLPARGLHLPVPHSHRDEDRWQEDGQAGAPYAAHWLLLGALHTARTGAARVSVLRVLQLRRVDDSVASRHLQTLLHTLPGCKGAGYARGTAHLPDIHGEIPVLNAGGGHVQCLAVLQQDHGQLAQLCGATAGQGATHAGPGVCLV